MCERFNLTLTSSELVESFELAREPMSWKPRFNISSMQRILAIRRKSDGSRIPELIQWGLVPRWAVSPTIGFQMVNARVEMVFRASAFRNAIRNRRCLIPLTGYYEWQQMPNGERRPWHIFQNDGETMAFAGLWEHWRASERTTLGSCTIMTTVANRSVKKIHPRMPVILSKEHWNDWLTADFATSVNLTDFLSLCSISTLDAVVVKDVVNNVKIDSPDCLMPIESKYAS